ncbi:sterile alpha motif domain containing 1a [Brachyhypopomus gauderio]|uniref:sterile alpha motif domain containing 1a n=1 Tax=Brachyhypopomus gauderio TaxID=698409 RepID=UPI0040410CF8
MSEPRYREWILETIDSLRSRKARPDLERICRMVRRRHGSEPDRTCLELEKLIQEQTVLKVNYKGSISYRNAAKVQRGRRKLERTTVKAAEKHAALPDLNTGDSALGPADEDQMEDMEDELSTTAGLDSSMDEEDVSLDASTMQKTTDSGVSMSPTPEACSASVSGGSPSPGPPEPDLDGTHSLPEHMRPAVQKDTGSPELELACQPAAICPSVQRSAMAGEEEEGPRAGESALTPDQLLPECRSSPHQDEAVGSGRAAHKGPAPPQEGKKCGEGEELTCSQGVEPAKSGAAGGGAPLKAEEMAQDPLQWSVGDVVSYFTAAGFPEQAAAFRTQEIDGKSLLLMQRSDVLTGLSIRLGPALKIYEHHVKVLQRSHFQEDADVFS